MKIAMVSHQADPPQSGGAGPVGRHVHVTSLARELGRRGHQVTIYTRRDDPATPDRAPLASGVLLERVPAGPPEPVSAERLLSYLPDLGDHLARSWTRDRPDIVHAHHWMSGLAALAGGRGLGLPVAQTFHSLGVVQRRHEGDREGNPPERIRLEKAIANTVDATIATCSQEREEMLRFGVPRDGLHLVPDGVDTELFTPEGPARPRNGLARLLYVGRLVPRKGVDAVIRALAGMPGAELVIAGGPPPGGLDRDDDVRRLRRIARACRVDDRVTFLGLVPHAEVPALVRSADVVVSAPAYEPFGRATVEAMACGVPVAASPVGGHLDSVLDGVTGIHVPPGEPAAIAREIRELLGDSTRRDAYGIAGTDRARSRFSWERVGREMMRVYEHLASPRPAALRA